MNLKIIPEWNSKEGCLRHVNKIEIAVGIGIATGGERI